MFSSKSASLLNYSQEDCLMAMEIHQQRVMTDISILHFILCSIGLLVSSIFIYVLACPSSRILHINLRISMVSVTFAAWIACVQLLITCLYRWFAWGTIDNPCDYMIDATFCSIGRFPVILAIYSTICGMICLTIERTIATIFYKTYEIHGSRIVAVLLISIQWIVSIAATVAGLLLRTEEGSLIYCTVYISHPRSSVYSLCLMSVIEALVIAHCVSLYLINKKRQFLFVNNAMHTLTERYQLQENVRVMSILIYAVTVHAALGFFGLAVMLTSSLLYRSSENAMQLTLAPYSEVVLLIVPLHSLLFPAVAIWKNARLQLATRKALFLGKDEERSRVLNNSPTRLEHEADQHFKMLNDMWNK